MTVDPAEVKAAVVDHVGPTLATLERDGAVPDELDLVEDGYVDSFGLLELITAIEARFGVEIDFAGTDVDELTALGPLCRYVAARSDGHGEIESDSAASEGDGHSALPTAPTPALLRTPGMPRRMTGRLALSSYRYGTRVRDKLFSVAVSGSFASFGRRTVVQLPVRLKNPRRIAIGSGTFVGAGAWLQVLDGDPAEVALTIGDGASIAGHCVLSAAHSIVLGASVSLARNVYVSDHAHAYDDPERPIVRQGIVGVEKVEIGDNAWLGENAVVLPGTRIGRGAVVSANSVVRGDVPDHTVVAGAPARVIRRFA